MTTSKFLITMFILFSTIITYSQAQQSIDEMVKEWERAKTFTKEYLDAMPESDFGLKPTPEMRSFAEQMLHLTDGNYLFASSAIGETSPVSRGESVKTNDKSKANVTKLVMTGYDYVISSIKKMTPAQLSEKTKLFDKYEMTRETVFAKIFEHQTHHRGQTTVYLRLAKVTPPNEKLF